MNSVVLRNECVSTAAKYSIQSHILTRLYPQLEEFKQRITLLRWRVCQVAGIGSVQPSQLDAEYAYLSGKYLLVPTQWDIPSSRDASVCIRASRIVGGVEVLTIRGFCSLESAIYWGSTVLEALFSHDDIAEIVYELVWQDSQTLARWLFDTGWRVENREGLFSLEFTSSLLSHPYIAGQWSSGEWKVSGGRALGLNPDSMFVWDALHILLYSF